MDLDYESLNPLTARIFTDVSTEDSVTQKSMDDAPRNTSQDPNFQDEISVKGLNHRLLAPLAYTVKLWLNPV